VKYLEDADLTLYQGDVSEILAGLEPESVHCVVTSPPYWGLRDYGTGVWDGGNPDCDHTPPKQTERSFKSGSGADGRNCQSWTERDGTTFRDVCPKCGARRVDSQLGLEATPELYLERMVQVFREVRRVLRSDGTCWLNIGDSYIAGQGGRQSAVGELPPVHREDRIEPGPRPDLPNPPSGWAERQMTTRTYPPASTGLKPKDLAMMPARLALALQADGWWLRSQIVWSKPNPMPESVTDRPTSSYELVYLLTKSPRYFFDQEAVRETAQDRPQPNSEDKTKDANGTAWLNNRYAPGASGYGHNPAGRNVRNVWEIATQPYPEAHFATYPEELVRRCILAGSSERGCCPECGAPWERQVEATGGTIGRDWNTRRDANEGSSADDLRHGVTARRETQDGTYRRELKGWLPGCTHDLPPVPCTVLDPFFGSGTTGLVARKHGRRTIGIELSAEYVKLAARRLQQLSLLA
jgi:DNA modification methylase